MQKQIFVNIPVKDLGKSIEFFTKLGFTFDEKFTDEKATCMIIGENIFAMLLVENFYKNFTNKQIIDAHKNNEFLIGLTAENREEVDEIYNKAITAGGTISNNAYDYGWTYGKSFQDLDGHIWEVFFLDLQAREDNLKNQ